MKAIIDGFRDFCEKRSCHTCEYKGASDQWECACRYAYEKGVQEGVKKTKETEGHESN